MYHVNPATGNPAACRASVRDCPFGDQEAHYETLELARAAYELTQETFSKKTKKSKVFRIGPLTPRDTHFADLSQLLLDFKETTPAGRPGRHDGLFASPDIQSHGRWVLGIKGMGGNQDVTSHELTVNPNEVYVYPVELYEIASNHQSWGRMDKFKEAAKDYWDAGLTLSEWQKWSAKAKPPPGSWEVILPVTEELNPKPVSNRRIIENASERFHHRLGWELEPRLAAKSKTWPRKETTAPDEIQ